MRFATFMLVAAIAVFAAGATTLADDPQDKQYFAGDFVNLSMVTAERP